MGLSSLDCEYSAWFHAVGHKFTFHGNSFREVEEKADNVMSQLACDPSAAEDHVLLTAQEANLGIQLDNNGELRPWLHLADGGSG